MATRSNDKGWERRVRKGSLAEENDMRGRKFGLGGGRRFLKGHGGME
jgi:hypothetical protein